MSTLTVNSIRDQRKYARLDIAISVSYAVKHADGEMSDLADALSSDISASGLRLMTPTALSPGDQIDLEISLVHDDSPCVKAWGEVVWQNKITDTSYETGAIIKHMDEADKARFMGFVFDQMSRFIGVNNGTLN